MNLLGKPDRMVQTAVAASHWQESSCLAEAKSSAIYRRTTGAEPVGRLCTGKVRSAQLGRRLCGCSIYGVGFRAYDFTSDWLQTRKAPAWSETCVRVRASFEASWRAQIDKVSLSSSKLPLSATSR